MLVLSRKLNEKIMIGDDIEVVIVEINPQQIKVGINAPKKVKVFRAEVYEEIQAANKRAAEGVPDKDLLDQLNQNIQKVSQKMDGDKKKKKNG